MLYDEEDCLPLSGVQHVAFCPRQFALIHVERQWAENLRTFEGRTLHERADDPFYTESRGTVLVTRSVPLLSRELGLYGIADVVEFYLRQESGIALSGREGWWQPFPVEYKRGKAKPDDRDAVQACAQAMCLEEMLRTEVPSGALFYGEPRRRQTLDFNGELRARVRQLAKMMHDLRETGETPPPTRMKACKSCSLEGLCLPRVTASKSVKRYMKSVVQEDQREDRST